MRLQIQTISIQLFSQLTENLNSDKFPIIIQYADFNVINYLFEANFLNENLNNVYFYPDSTIIYFYINFSIKKTKKFISTDFQYNLLNFCNKNRKKVFFLGDEEAILKGVKHHIKLDYPDIEIVGTVNGYDFESSNVIKKINSNDTDILFVGLGVGRQEKWILENYELISSKIIISVGGWFQYLSGNKKRAPKILRRLHLEWLHKLIFEFPRVWKRYLIGVPLFFYRIITKKIVIEYTEE